MKRFTGLCFAALLLVFANRPSYAAEKMRVSFGALNGPQSPVWVAKERGFFKKHGIDAEVIYIVGTQPSAQAMIAREVHLGAIGPSAVVRATLAGGDLVYVAGMFGAADFVLVTQKEITNINQLRGKRVGIGRFGGGPDFTVRVVLEQYGLRPEKDVTILQMGVGNAGRLAALQAKAIESIIIGPPFTFHARKQGFNLLVNFSEAMPDFISAGLATTRTYARQNPKAAENGIKALIDACEYIRSNEEGTLEIIGRYMRVVDKDILKEYYREIVKDITGRYYLNAKAVELVLEQEKKTDPKAAKAKPVEFIDHSFLDRLKKEGYF